MTKSSVSRARAALSRGDVLIAYDEAVSALDSDPDDLDARYFSALALARAGATDRARVATGDLVVRVGRTVGVAASLREDAAALNARLAKDEALAARDVDRRGLLRRAGTLYEAVGNEYGGFYAFVNAATMSFLAGDTERARALARHTLDALAAGPTTADSDYWRAATRAEAALILGDVDGAYEALGRASRIAKADYAAMAATRRQLRLLCAATDTDPTILETLALPLVLHYCGHRIGTFDDGGRFPADLERYVVDEVSRFLDDHDVGFAYGSLASGADILIAEGLLERGARLEVVLPFDAAEFEQISVAPAGDRWVERFHSCRARAASVVYASDSAFMNDHQLFGYAARIAMGHAVDHAIFIDTTAEQLAVWDRVASPAVAGTAHDVAVWSAAGYRSNIIELPAAATTVSSPRSAATTRRIGAILFTDFRGFSRLRDEQFPSFIHHVYEALAGVLERHGDKLLWRNVWGDAVAAVFADVNAAAECALGFHDVLEAIDLPAIGLPGDMNLRVGGHAGPVLAIADPISRRQTYWGRELTRGARIEPRTPEGQVYVTDAFAALLALEPGAPFATEYVGRVTTAKDFETIPMYRLTRQR